MSMSICHVSPPDGRGSGTNTKKRHSANFEDYLKKKKCLVTIKNADDLCFQRAIVVARHYANKQHTPEWERERKRLINNTGPHSWQTKKTEALIDAVDGARQACMGMETWELYAKYLGEQGYQLNVFSRAIFGKAIYRGTKHVTGTPKHLNLYLHDRHYDVITSMPAFVERSYFCETCQVGYDHAEIHSCHVMCHGCKTMGPPCPPDPNTKTCYRCHRVFVSRQCFDNHLATRSRAKCSVCHRWKKCEKCQKEWDVIKAKRNLEEHRCGEYECSICREWHTAEKQFCYIQPLKSPIDMNKDRKTQIDKLQKSTLTRFVFFDFECQQDTGEHIPNLCVLQTCCHFCIDNQDPCEHCDMYWNHQREIVFKGPDTLDDVGKWFLQLAAHGTVINGRKHDSHESSPVIAVAHNFKGYDGLLILQTLHKHSVAQPEVIMNGGKAMTITVGTVKFIDSLNFLPMALRDMPKTFGLQELKKGYFPHHFNKPENEDYVGAYPPDTDYDPDGMSVSEREKFHEWYQQHSHDVFDFRQEILAYCKSDVDVLRRCCGVFREIFLMDTGIDPFEKSLTLASACSRVLRTHYLKKDTLVVIPRALMQQPKLGKDWHRFQPRQQSNKALRWLEWEQHRQTMAAFRNQTPLPNIRHARNGSECRVGPYSLDGMDTTTGTVYEFHGCAFHGCPKCYPGPVQDLQHKHPYDPSRSMRDLYQKTQERHRRLQEQYGMQTIRVMWECELEEERRHNPEMNEFLQGLEDQQWPAPEPLMPRNAFFGGRTNAIQLLVNESVEDMRYIDVVSLYPYICKYGTFPIKEPTIVTQPDQDQWQQYEGLIQCSVLPPRGLYHPVLSFRRKQKLVFALCRSCVDEHMQQGEIAEYQPCEHTDEQRAWVGTFVTLELKKAVALGYQVLKVYEVWHWKEFSTYDPEAKTGGLFTGYINHYLKKKMESSGYPDTCHTEEDKTRFVNDVYDTEGIRLDPTSIKPNKGMRAFSKLQLNTAWGKFGQRDNFPKTEYITEPSVYFEKMLDVTQTVRDVQLVNDNMVLMETLKKEEHVAPCPITNVVIAAFVTAQARLKLYSVLEKLGERVCYFDTDSVIYQYHTTSWNPPEGSSLGQWKNELPEDVTIREFVSGGPKNYAYRQSDGKTVCKVRGFTLNYRASQQLNYAIMKENVRHVNQNEPLVIANPFKITRSRDRRLWTRPENKRYKIVYDKRFVQFNDDGQPSNTYPYGY
ncbi:hypothetical protein SNE40_020708 [Patella caerulea]|uniref:DNA-directed DNA polymerase n=1 Tax=Patella caerulea TaxID=87958 RepID=A0AAN8J6B1_PATCE